MADIVPKAKSDTTFRPPPKGDVTLRSSDGEEFRAHSAILCLASSVFEGLCLVGTNKDVVELSESTETISLMLQFIYPNKKGPTMVSFDMLASCLLAAQKYDLEGMLETIDEQLASKTGPQSLVHQDPLRAYGLSVQFNLPDTKTVATPLVVAGGADFSDPSSLAELIQSHPSTSVLHLTAIQSTQGKMIADVLLHFSRPPISPVQTYIFYNLSCAACRVWMNQCKTSNTRVGMAYYNPPSFLLAWIEFAYETLLHTSLEASDQLFEWTVLRNLKNKSSICQDCLADFSTNESKQSIFGLWSNDVKKVLKQRLEGLQHLYSL
ncbi:hypothetical protein BDV93DRAFT_606818 [Ceratobasidium sp. AG-I]|nr:hypothetical protein BDV93DRAFT_606818 [Ceratobasidium sp. AG-I]